MRLFLSSENLGNYPEVFLKMLGENNRVAVIHNAIDDWPLEEKHQKIKQHKDQLRSQGFETEEIDLREYFGSSQKLAKKIQGVGGIFVFGGNTFILRRAFADSGIDRLLTSALKDDELVYGGSSAGSIVMTPSLKGTEWGDDPDQVQKIYHRPIIWDALNIVPFYIVPHCGTDWFGKEAQQMIDYLENNNLPYKGLHDGEVVVVDGDKIEVLK